MSTGIEAGYWRDVVGAEYDALPTLSLTLAQAQRLWSIDDAMAYRVLDSYVESGYLTHTPDGSYRRSDYAQGVAVGSGPKAVAVGSARKAMAVGSARKSG